MKNLLVLLSAICSSYLVQAQHENHLTAATGGLSTGMVLEAALTDSALKDYELLSMTLNIPAGYADSTAHRHDADLFGYVLKGTVKIELEGGGMETYRQGQMFHERRNILHKRLENGEAMGAAEVLIIYVIRKGRNRYTEQKKNSE